MRLALIHPAGPPPAPNPLRGAAARLPAARFSFASLERMPSLSLLTVAALLRATGRFETLDRFDGNLAPLPAADALATYDAALFTGFTCRFDEARALSDALRRRGIRTVAGGVHASHADDAAFFDTLFRGELEPLAEPFAADLAARRAAPAYGPAPLPAGPLVSPVPDYRGIPADAVVPVQLSRGCPFDCSFCIATRQGGAAFRPRPLPDAERLLEAALAEGRRHLFIVDDNLFLDRAWAVDILALLRSSGARFVAHSDLRVANDPDLLARLASSGCHALLAGIETVGQESLEEASAFKARMGMTAADAVRRIQDAGVGVIGSFVAGFDHDDPAVFDRIAAFAEETALLEICVKALTPYPGTALHARLAAAGRLHGAPLAAHDARRAVFRPARMGEAELEAGIARTLERFARPEQAAARIAAMKAAVKRRGDVGGSAPEPPPGIDDPRIPDSRAPVPRARGEQGRRWSGSGACGPSGVQGWNPCILPRRVLLVHPRVRAEREPAPLARMRAANEARLATNIYRTPPLALAQVASLLPESCEAVLADEAAGDPLPDLSGFDLLLVTASTCQAPRAIELADAARACGAASVVGGAHATAAPGDFADHFDVVFTGEAEGGFPGLLAAFSAGAPRRRCDAARPADLDDAPMPRLDLFPRGRYDFIPLQAGRGCPRGCAYCASTALFGAGLRRKGAERLAREAAALSAAHPGAPAYIVDDNLFADPTLADDAIRALAKSGVRFLAYGDPSLVERPDLPARLAAAGCMRLLVGFDSLDPATLKRHAPGKARLLPRYAELVDRFQSAGVALFGGFIAGFDEDTPETFERIAAFVESTGLSECCVSVLTPLPGAPLHERLLAEGRITDPDLAHRDGHHLVFRHPTLTQETVERGILHILDRHLAPAAIRARTAAMKAAVKARAGAPPPDPRRGSPTPGPPILAPLSPANAGDRGEDCRGLGPAAPAGCRGGTPALQP